MTILTISEPQIHWNGQDEAHSFSLNSLFSYKGNLGEGFLLILSDSGANKS